ncbi:MAG: YaiO family outer membrane beta-barrel protein, partial [Balneolaceae bacterium]|nr:YaiO family outer membrane beta-barrel protein [Balneolaceae bacterium]
NLYPVFSENTYAHLGAGASLTQKGLFPNLKASGILYANLTHSLVGGIGLRYQSFDIDDVFVYSTNLHWYVQDFLIMLQGFMQYRNETPLGTGVLTLRKYLTNPDYIFLKLAYGQSPQGLRFEEDVIDTFESVFVSVGGDLQVSSTFRISASVEYRHNTFSSVTSRNRYGFSIGFSYQF